MLVLLMGWNTARSIIGFKTQQDKYDRAKKELDAKGGLIVDAKVADVKKCDVGGCESMNCITYEFTAPNGDEYEHEMTVSMQREVGDTDRLLIIVDENGEYDDIEYAPQLPLKPSLQKLISDVMTMVLLCAFLIFLSK